MNLQTNSVKRAIFVLLFIILVAVWSYDLLQLLPREPDAYSTTATGGSASESLSWDVRKIDQLSEIDYIGDPFQPFFIHPDTAVITAIERVAPNITPPDIAYLGLIQGQSGKQAIIQMADGYTEIVRPHDLVFGIKVLSFDDATFKYNYRGKVFMANRGQ